MDVRLSIKNPDNCLPDTALVTLHGSGRPPFQYPPLPTGKNLDPNSAYVQQKRYVTETELLQDAYKLGVQIAESDFRPTFIVGLWRGGSVVGIAVQECLQYIGIPTDHIAIRTSYRGLASYQQMVDNPDAEIRVHGTQYLLDTLSRTDSLLLVDDVFSSGLTASAVITRLSTRLKNNMPEHVRVAVPWYKPAHNRTSLKPDFYLNTTDDWLVMPYELSGLTHEEIASNKPWILPILASLDEGQSS